MKAYKSVLIIYNPMALKGKIEDKIPYIKQRLSLRYDVVDAMNSPNKNGAEELALKFANHYDIIVSCGGDGTLHEIVNGIKKANANVLIGILPFGTCNDVARTLKIPFDLDKAIDCILRLDTMPYDIMFDGERYITYSLATGYLTKVSYATKSSAKRRFGRFAYFMQGIKSIFKYKSLPITLIADGERVHGKFSFLAVLNGEHAGGFRINKNDNFDDGKAKVILINRDHLLPSLFSFIRLFMFGVNSIKKRKSVIVRNVSNIEIENHANAPFTIDGEKVKFLKKTITVKDKITIITK